MNTPFCIETRNLTKTFDDKVAINNLSLNIPNGGIHAIVGSNGAGKSTLFRILLGVETASAGSASILGESSTRLSPANRAKFAYVNEEHTLPTWMIVADLVDMQKRLYPKWNNNIYRHVVGYFDVDEKQKVSGLSRGERAGLNLAMVLAQQADLIILDEPTLGLDVVAKQSFLEALLFAGRTNESTVVYCSHQMDEIERVAENLIILERGALTNNSSPDDFVSRISRVLFDNEQHNISLPTLYKELKGLLNIKRIDELYQLTFVDQNQGAITQQLQSLGIEEMSSQYVNLNEAVNAFLSKHHSKPTN